MATGSGPTPNRSPGPTPGAPPGRSEPPPLHGAYGLPPEESAGLARAAASESSGRASPRGPRPRSAAWACGKARNRFEPVANGPGPKGWDGSSCSAGGNVERLPARRESDGDRGRWCRSWLPGSPGNRLTGAADRQCCRSRTGLPACRDRIRPGRSARCRHPATLRDGRNRPNARPAGPGLPGCPATTGRDTACRRPSGAPDSSARD